MKTKKINTSTRRAASKRSALKKNLHHQVKMAVVPHKANRYQPRMTSWYGLAMLVIVTVALQLGYSAFYKGVVLGDEAQRVTLDALVDATNHERSQTGQRPLRLSKELSLAAQLKIQNMFDEQYWAHTSASGVSPWHWIDKAGYDYSYAGENLAKNFTTAEGAATAWMASPEHRKNMLSDRYEDVGFAVMDGMLEGKDTTLIVALYGAPKKDQPALAGAVDGPRVAAAATEKPIGPLTHMAIAIESMTPAALIAVVLLVGAALVALGAQGYRHYLPKRQRAVWWRHHHGFLKASGMMAVSAVMIWLYGVGQI